MTSSEYNDEMIRDASALALGQILFENQSQFEPVYTATMSQEDLRVFEQAILDIDTPESLFPA